MVNSLATQANGDHTINSHLHQHHLIHDIHGAPRRMHGESYCDSRCNLCCRLIPVNGQSLSYRVAYLRAGLVGRFSYDLYL